MNEDKLHPAVEKILNSSMNSPTLGKPEKMKHEEIKRMAWEMFLRSPDDIKIKTSLEASWLFAEKFYNYAKEKEEGSQ